jgi:predicted permease
VPRSAARKAAALAKAEFGGFLSGIDVSSFDSMLLSMNALATDVRIALRQYQRKPAFAVTVVCTLALAIGATAAVVSVVNSVLVRTLPFGSPERLVWISSVRPDNPNAPFTLPEFMDYRSRTRTMSGLAAYANWSASLAGDGVTERLQGARMSANAFDVLGVSAAAGRLLTDRDDRADAPQVAVVSYRLWQRHFGGAADAIGKTARINGEAFTIVGVLPTQFPLPLRDIDVVIPLAPDRDPLRHVRGSVNFLRFFGRLNDGIDAARAEAELTAICGSLRQQFPIEYARKERVSAVALHEALVGDYRQSMALLLGAVAIVLAAALANLVSLALVRANDQRGELSMRIAIGASRLHLARQLTVEALMLAILGGSLGWMLARWAIAVVVPLVPASVPRLGEVTIDRTAALFIAAVTAVATIVLSGAPLGVMARTRAGDVLRSASRGSIGDRWNHRVRDAMVVAEISAALVLLLVTMILIQNLRGLQNVDPGFNPEGVFHARVSIPASYRSPDDLSRFYDRLYDRIVSSPDVERAGVVSIAPLSGLLATVPFSVEGVPPTGRDRPSTNLRAISPDYFATVGTRLMQGRPFAESDRSSAPPVALVSAALAARFLPEGAIGRRLLIDDNNDGPRPVEVVGVVANVRQAALDAPPALDVYIPLRQVHADGVSFLRNNQFWMVKTRSDPGAFRATFLAHLRAVDPDAAVSSTGPMRRLVDGWLGPRRFNLGLFAAFALTAVWLAVSGLYGLVSYAVSQRTAEIGVRMAIGATARDVQWLILRQAVRLGTVGAAIGTLLIGAIFPLLSDLARDEHVRIDPAHIAATAAALVAIVTVAAWLPARRATRIDPTTALRIQ